MNDKKTIMVPIKGMHCKSCELLVEDNLMQLPGAEKVSVDHKAGQAEISYQGDAPERGAIEEKVRQSGYEIGKDEETRIVVKDKEAYKDLAFAAAVLVGIYFLAKGLGLGSLSAGSVSDNVTIPVILLVGLTAGVSTCMALVGGLVLGISANFAKAHPDKGVWRKFLPHLWFNAGRVIGFSLLGGLLGVIGSYFEFSPFGLGVMTMFVGLVMLAMGLKLIGIFPWAEKLNFVLPKKVSRIFGAAKQKESYSHNGAFVSGVLTFFLPCGFTQAMQLMAVSYGAFSAGALIMGLFAVGTIPGLLGIGGMTSVVKGRAANRFYKMAGLAVILLSLFNVNNGLALSGVSMEALGKEEAAVADDPNVKMVNGVQVVRMAEDIDGYSPNRFTVKKGVPVKWIIDAKQPYSCASALVVPKLDISKKLVAGENVIDFVPSEIGRINFSCSMGMYTGSFNVVDDNGQGIADESLDENIEENEPHACSGHSSGEQGGCGCGGSSASCGGGCGLD